MRRERSQEVQLTYRLRMRLMHSSSLLFLVNSSLLASILSRYSKRNSISLLDKSIWRRDFTKFLTVSRRSHTSSTDNADLAIDMAIVSIHFAVIEDVCNKQINEMTKLSSVCYKYLNRFDDDCWQGASGKQINQNLLNMTTEFKLLRLMKSKPILPVTYHEYGSTKYHMSQWEFRCCININMVGLPR